MPSTWVSQFNAAFSRPGRIGSTAFTHGAFKNALRMSSPSSCRSHPSDAPSGAGEESSVMK